MKKDDFWPKYSLDIGRAIEVIKEFNNSVTISAPELLIWNLFRDDFNFKRERAACAVVLLDGLWKTQLFRHEEDFDRITNNIAECSRKIVANLAQLKKDDLKDYPEKVYRIAKEVFPIVLGRPSQRQNYSFTSKFFHWCAREHFPIMDNNARKAINRFQKRHNLKRGILVPSSVTDSTYIEDYKRWIYFYSALLNSLSPAQSQALLNADHASQCHDLRVSNTLLRVLDKVFYFVGKSRYNLFKE